MNLFSFGLLYTTVVSFITLWFQYVNVLYPDINQYHSGVLSSIRWATAILVVVFPVFVVTAWLLGKDFKQEPEKREVRARKWLVYLTLFVSAITIVVDLVTLVYNFLDGGLTMAFFLKILVVLVAAVAVFGYYIWDLRRTNFKSQKPKLFAWLAGAIILASVIYAFFLVGTPAQQRDRRFDEQRVNDLGMIQNEVINYWTRKNVLPAKLDELNNDLNGFRVPLDPIATLIETSDSASYGYGYKVINKLSFELCANFATSSKYPGGTLKGGNYPRAVIEAYPYPGPYNQNWDHEAGRVCFVRTIDPSLYKNNPNAPVPLKY